MDAVAEGLDHGTLLIAQLVRQLKAKVLCAAQPTSQVQVSGSLCIQIEAEKH
jgi:hypothetical protein